MDKDVEVLAWAAALAGVALAAFLVYRWRLRARARRITAWVEAYLARRDGGTRNEVQVGSTSDRLWPVLASFVDGKTGARHRLRFACGGDELTYSLVSEVVDAPRA